MFYEHNNAMTINYDKYTGSEKEIFDQLIQQYIATIDQAESFDHINTKLSEPNAKWRVVSYFQKSVRLGLSDHAQRAVNALISGGQEAYLLRRMAVTALEDIGIANPVLAATMLAFARSKKARDSVGSPRVLMNLARDMAKSNKSRLACDIAVMAGYSPKSNTLKKEMAGKNDRNVWYEYFVNEERDIVLRMLAGSCLDGSLTYMDDDNKKQYVKGSQLHMLTSFDVMGLPDIFKAMCYWGARLGLEGLGMATALAYGECVKHGQNYTIESIDMEDPIILKGMLSASYDMHTREGKQAYAYFSKTCPDFSKLASKMGANKVALAGNCVFIMEGSLLQNHLRFEQAGVYKHQAHRAQMEASGIDLEEHPNAVFDSCNMIGANMHLIHAARDRILKS